MLPKKGLIEGKSETSHQGTPQINLAEKDDEIIAAVVVEANLVENKDDWILDTGASRQFCSNKALFHELLETTDGECVFMGKSTTAGVWGKGKILLKLTSGQTLALNEVLYVPSLHKNLVSVEMMLHIIRVVCCVIWVMMDIIRAMWCGINEDGILTSLCCVVSMMMGYHTSYVLYGIKEKKEVL
ncbi:Retrovirus-related Pol polyprotein from transposon RE2 [Sesamum angolense]|uniref:Retrovirus-related Pol polyprotein from transposon RE2 n=1 Tax=Sesamum angolense TaxID=2727404 RepID=A0AAE1T8Y7_9LAMI|nr:Retrovirus-related Pol polyprotein from transposon RE2 [Sesamum angolense]